MILLEQLLQQRRVAIIRGVSPEKIVPVVSALLAGGFRCVEITYNHSRADGIEETLQSIRAVSNHFGSQVLLGAGTVLSERQVQLAADAGAGFMISPNTNRAVIEASKKLQVLSIPGALTPTEVVYAHELGADLVKLFPAGVFGTGYLKAICAPLAHIPVMAVGGISPENQQDFIQAGACCLGIGDKLVNSGYVACEDYQSITEVAKKYVQMLPANLGTM